MKLNLFFPVLLIFISFVSSLLSQVDEGRRITKELCSENHFGRGYVKGGDSIAADFLASEFEKRKLKPIKKSYFQTYQFSVNTFPKEMNVTVDGKNLIPGVDFIVDPNSGSFQGDVKSFYFNKNAIQHTEFIEHVKSILYERIDINTLIFDLTSLSNDSVKFIKSLSTSLLEFKNVILISDEKFTYSVGRSQLKNVCLTVKPSYILPESSINIQVDAFYKKNHVSRNVYAILPAKKRTKKYILFTAHYDHLGGMGNQTYFPGANDNASGTSMLFTLADYFKQNPSKYNILFIAFSGEEAGLVGSEYFVKNSPIPLKNIRMVLNLDIMGSGEDGITVVNATEHPSEFQLLQQINTEKELLSLVKPRGKTSNSDHFWFSENGVPAFFIYTMGGNKNYHDVFDTYEALTFAKYENIIRLLTEFVTLLD
jgi:aminopeptidase YwaD